ncbi:hypothetical protein ACTMTF_25615 [Nonomuraea sp. ZG12]|uniref:hypothetical protein n=1 Tax=Nonomuraea sp. ZG12 TaxID=3452207 RepID=UPI003F8951D3
MPPFAAPTPEDPQDPPKGRRPYSSPTAEPEVEPRRRRTVDRPDKLVASGPPRPTTPPSQPPSSEPPSSGPPPSDAPPDVREQPARRDPRTAPYRMAHRPPAPGAAPTHAGEDPVRPPDAASPYAGEEPVRASDAGPAHGGEEVARASGVAHDDFGHDEEFVRPPDEQADDGEESVRRVGRPPGGRPTRPDLLVASGPERSSSGRHHRGPAPAALRRAGPMRRRRGVPVPVVLAVALAVLVAGGVLVWQWGGAGDPGLSLATGTGRSGDDLFTVPASTGQGSVQKLNDVVAVGGAVVAVGSDTTSPTPRPLFLFSPDGKKWQLGKVTGSTTPTVRRVVGGAGRWLASGGDGLTERGMWTSADGLTWQAVEPAGMAAFRDGDLVNDIARTASGFVAVGRVAQQDGGSGTAAWRSTDGRAWERVETRGLGVGELKAVVAKGDTVVALAQPGQGDGSRVIRSADGGRSWQATGFQLPEAQPRIGSLAVAPKRFVLVPTRQRTIAGDVRVYCSPTGAEWSQCGTIGGLSRTSPGVESLISHASGVAAISQASLGGYSVLNSADGRDWDERAELRDLAGATLRGFAISRGGTLFAGGDQAAADVDNQLVLMTVPSRGKPSRVRLEQVAGLSRVARETSRVAGHEGRYVAVGSASGDAGIWTSLNWQDWRSISLGGQGSQQLHDVAFGRRGWLAVGGTQTALQVTEPLLVTSRDGRQWKRVGISGDLARPGDHPYLDARVLAAGPEGYVLAGEDRAPSGTVSAAVWFTPDLRRFTRSKKLPQGGSNVRLHDLAATPAGYVAVGGAGAGGDESGVVWVSEDGVNWKARKRVAPPESTSAGLRQVAAFQDRLVAIGTAQPSTGGRRAFSAVSEDDGVTWTTAWLPAERAAEVYDLAAAEQGLVAVGRHGEPGEGDSAAWISRDGSAWSRLDLAQDRLGGPGGQWLTAVTVAGEEVVALGRSTTYSDDHLILWTSTLTASR